MKFKSPTLAMTALATAMLAAPVNPASAAPAGITAASTAMLNGIGSGANVVDVQHRRKHKRSSRHRSRRHHWRGHRGSRHWRPGYRRHSSGWWFPLAAFGALAAGAAAANAGDLPPAHYRWCDNRYRSYDPATDTFQPYNGPRKYCNSPYDGR
jgi:hypothetical protein